MIQIGFNVQDWSNKPFKNFTNEELLEYWYKLRLTTNTVIVDFKSSSTDLYIVELQHEILNRMIEREG